MPALQVARTTVIDSPPERVFAAVADFRGWSTWSPWLTAEPDAQVRVTENPNSLGSVYSWSGELVGAGEIEHVELVPAAEIHQELRFLKPFRSTARVRFDISPEGDGSRITWTMNGSLPWFMFWMRSLMEAVIGNDYERGLRMLKELMETGEILSHTRIEGVAASGPYRVLGKRASCSLDEVGASMQAAYGEVDQAFQDSGISREGEAISVYHRFDFRTRRCEYTSGYAVPADVPSPPGLAEYLLPRGSALVVRHVGRYEHLGNAWSAAHQYARYKSLKLSRKVDAFEIYRNAAANPPEADLTTDICLPLK